MCNILTDSSDIYFFNIKISKREDGEFRVYSGGARVESRGAVIKFLPNTTCDISSQNIFDHYFML